MFLITYEVFFVYLFLWIAFLPAGRKLEWYVT